MAICNLCKKDKQLIKKSHIIPDFIYRNSDMYDVKQRLYKFTEDIKNQKKLTQVPTGVYDKNILCAQCDNEVIGQYEYYASSLTIHKKDGLQNYFDKKENLTICKDVNYQKYKLFLLSILFRASLSKNPFFSSVNLSENNLESLRQMIIDGKPHKHNDFPFFVSTFATCDGVPLDFAISPHRNDEHGFVTYTFPFGGMCYLFYEGINLNISSLSCYTMKQNNELKISHLKGEKGIKYFKRLSGFVLKN